MSTIGTEVASALKWSSLGKLGGQLISWAVTILVLRFLTPADYGLLAIATVFVSLIMMLGEVGVQFIVVRARELTESFLRSVFGLVVVSHAFVALCTAVSAVAVARYYGDARIQPIMTAIGLNALLIAFTQIPGALLVRELNFRAQAAVALVASLAQSAATLGLAYYGAGVWSLVIGQFVSSVVMAVVLNRIRPSLRMPSFDFAPLEGHLAFGSWIVAQRVIWWLINSFDQLLLGKLIGPVQLGFYAVANQIASLPKDKLSQIINQVTFPAVVRLSDKPKQLRSNLLTALSIMSTVLFPIFAIISAMADDIVTTILSDKWAGALMPLALLPLAMPFRMLAAPLAEAMNALGRASITARLQIVSLVLVVAGIALGSHWGVVGVSVAWIVLANINLALFVSWTRQFSGVGYVDLLHVMLGPIACSAVAYATVFAVAHPNGATSLLDHGFLRLIVVAVLAGTTYSAASFLFNRSGVRNVLGLLLQGRSAKHA